MDCPWNEQATAGGGVGIGVGVGFGVGVGVGAGELPELQAFASSWRASLAISNSALACKQASAERSRLQALRTALYSFFAFLWTALRHFL
ncbi:hypothetical protein D3C87_1349190 [compost metagenome]